MKPLDKALKKYEKGKFPEWAPIEEETDAKNWERTKGDESYPGEGLLRYPMLFIGEGNNEMLLVKNGEVVWTFSAGKGWEYDDVWMLTNGNILFSRMYWAAMITPDKKYVWRYDVPEGCEIHTLQPIGEDKVMYVLNKKPYPEVVIYNIKSEKEEYRHEIPYDENASVHGQFRRFRMTAEGTFLAACLSMNVVKEYDMEFNEIWSYEIGKPWAAIRLKNGNTLITSEKEGAQVEVNRNKERVWEYNLSEIPEKYRIYSTQSCVRLDNGNTIICSMGDKGKTPQLIEVTKEKEIVWVLKDWENLGPATAIQILNESGIPEKPGDCQR